jgi:hypothetical protein
MSILTGFTYVHDTAFTVTGDQRSAYPKGLVVYEPINGKLCSVVESIYSTVTYVYLSDSILTADIALLYTQKSRTFTNLCSGGTAISGGGVTASKCFDGAVLTTDAWVSSQTTGSIANVAYIGYDFNSTATPTPAISWVRYCGGGASNRVSPNAQGCGAVALRYSDNGTAWTTTAEFKLVDSCYFQLLVAPIPAAGHRYWSLLCTVDGTSAGNGWSVQEIEMGVV